MTKECLQDCPIGAICNGNSLKGLVNGSHWEPNLQTGYYNLVSCPAKYEIAINGLANGSFALQAQECIPCPAARYCPGGSDPSAPCLEGTFALPGTAATLANCFPVTFVSITVQVQPRPSIASQSALLHAVAMVASVTVDTVFLVGATDGAGNSSLFRIRIATDGVTRANSVCMSLRDTRISLPELEVCLVLTCSLDEQILGTSNEMFTAAMIIGISVAVILCTISGVIYMRRHNVENEMANATKKLRRRLRIEPKDGYLLGSDWTFPWQNNTNSMHLPKSCIESATKLSLLRDFNPLEFDEFCVRLILPAQRSAGRGVQQIALYDWNLEIGRWLLQPNIKADKSTINPETGNEWTERERVAYLKKLCKCQVCRENKY